MSKKQADIRNWFNAGETKELELENKEHCNDNDNLEKPKTREILVFTDGSTLNNGSVNARGGVGVFFGNNDSRNISKKIIGKKVTNNICELMAVILAIQKVIETEDTTSKIRIVIMTDSEYIVKSVLKYSVNWKKNGYKNKQGKPIKNMELMKKVIELTESYNVKLHHCLAHKSEPKDSKKRKIWYGNKMADSLARQGSK